MEFTKYIIQWPFTLLFYLKWTIRHFSSNIHDSSITLKGKTAIVTGGNSGIGYAISMLLASKGCRVIIACRRDATEQVASIIKSTENTEITTKRLDLSKFKSVRQFVQDIMQTEEKIDILVNNAGIAASSIFCTEDGLNTVMQVNYFGHVLLTYLLMDKLRASSSPRVMFLSSILANYHNLTIENLNETDFTMHADTVASHYSNSKVCNILAAQEMSKELEKYGIKVNSVDPGISRTPIFSDCYEVDIERKWFLKCSLESLILFFGRSEYTAAQTVIHLATAKEIPNGSHFFRCRQFDKPRILNDQKLCGEIWLKTKELIKIE